jgi:tRNA(Arg) A34 adenosine deaminase TadA
MKQRFFNLAKRISKHSDHPQHQLGCIIVDKNKVITVGFNKVKTHPKSTARFAMLHAEISAVLGMASEELKGCTAYVYREDRQGNTAMSRPCPACYEALKIVGIKRICYTTNEGFKEELVA